MAASRGTPQGPMPVHRNKVVGVVLVLVLVLVLLVLVLVLLV